jgi:hypothetical protein
MDVADPKLPQCESFVSFATAEINPRVLTDDPKAVNGAPCAIQVAGRRLQDEELLSRAEVIADILEE